MTILTFKQFESINLQGAALWDDFINKIQTGKLPTQVYDKDLPKVLSKVEGKTILDIGFGDGLNSEYMINKGYEVTGTDISPLAVKMMHEKFPLMNWITHDTVKKFPLNKQFDLIYARLSLHYFQKNQLKNILSNIKNLLKPSGLFYFSVKISQDIENTGKILMSEDEWCNILPFNIIEQYNISEKSYTFESNPSQILKILCSK